MAKTLGQADIMLSMPLQPLVFALLCAQMAMHASQLLGTGALL
jgi:hypothetical protein